MTSPVRVRGLGRARVDDAGPPSRGPATRRPGNEQERRADVSCVFCEIVAGRAPATVVKEWPETIAIVPLGPVVDGHTLIIPREHVADAVMDDDVTAATMVRAAQFAAKFESSNILTSIGRAATQSIFHLHIHVVPRAVDDQLMVPWGTVYGDDPQAPHWCRVAQKLSEELEASRFAARNNRVLLEQIMEKPS